MEQNSSEPKAKVKFITARKLTKTERKEHYREEEEEEEEEEEKGCFYSDLLPLFPPLVAVFH
jgi:hypothetical protein